MSIYLYWRVFLGKRHLFGQFESMFNFRILSNFHLISNPHHYPYNLQKDETVLVNSIYFSEYHIKQSVGIPAQDKHKPFMSHELSDKRNLAHTFKVHYEHCEYVIPYYNRLVY